MFCIRLQSVLNSSRAGTSGISKSGQPPTGLQPPQPASMHDAARLLPPDLFRPALSKVQCSRCQLAAQKLSSAVLSPVLVRHAKLAKQQTAS